MIRWLSLAALLAALAVAMSGVAVAASTATDNAAARAGVLTLPDFPSGWASKARSSNSSSALEAKLVKTIPACNQFVPLIGNAKSRTRAQSPARFTDGVTTVDNTVSVYTNVKKALEPFAASKTPAFSACFQPLLTAALREQLARNPSTSQIQNLAVAVQPTTPAITAGDDQSGFAATVSFSIGRLQESVYFEDVVIRVGRALDTISYENDTGPVSDFVPSAVMASVTRVQAALTA